MLNESKPTLSDGTRIEDLINVRNARGVDASALRS